MVFQNFVAREVSEMVLSVTNKDKIPRLVKVCMESCPYFQLASPRGVYHMVPAGASAPVRICFSPEENKDYSHELTCITTRGRIVVPIRAIAARAVLDFPEQLDFSTCPVKSSSQKTLLLHNSGNLEARFQLSTQSEIFGRRIRTECCALPRAGTDPRAPAESCSSPGITPGAHAGALGLLGPCLSSPLSKASHPAHKHCCPKASPSASRDVLTSDNGNWSGPSLQQYILQELNLKQVHHC